MTIFVTSKVSSHSTFLNRPFKKISLTRNHLSVFSGTSIVSDVFMPACNLKMKLNAGIVMNREDPPPQAYQFQRLHVHILCCGEDVYLTYKHKTVQPSQVNPKAKPLDKYFTEGHGVLSANQQKNLVDLFKRLETKVKP